MTDKELIWFDDGHLRERDDDAIALRERMLARTNMLISMSRNPVRKGKKNRSRIKTNMSRLEERILEWMADPNSELRKSLRGE